MLQIKINNEFADLGDFSITFELLNPIFNDVGSYSYPFTLPSSPRNRRIFGFPERINSNQIKKTNFEADIFVYGQMWKRGVLIIREVNDVSIKANFGVGEGYFYNSLKDISLRSIDLGGRRDRMSYYTPTISPNTHWNRIYDKFWPETDFTLFPLQFPKFHDKEQPLYSGSVNDYIPSGTGLHLYYNVPNNHFVLFPFLNYVLQQIFRHLNISVKENIFTNHAGLSQLVLLNNSTLNYFNNEQQTFLMIGGNFTLNEYMPDANISELLQHLEQTFLAYPFYNEFDHSVSIKLMRDILTSSPVALHIPFRLNSINPNEYDGFTFNYDFDGDDELLKTSIKDLTDYTFKGTVNTVQDLPYHDNEYLDLYFVKSTNTYHYFVPFQNQWVNTFASDSKYYIEGNGKLKINYSNVFARDAQNKTLIGLQGNIQTLGVPYEEPDPPKLRLLQWFGIQNIAFQNVPYGSAYNTKPDGSIIGPYSLEWSGEYGVKEKFFKEWLHFQSVTRQAEFSALLTPAQIKNIDFSTVYRFLQANWLFDTIRFTVSNKGISPATVTAWKV